MNHGDTAIKSNFFGLKIGMKIGYFFKLHLTFHL